MNAFDALDNKPPRPRAGDRMRGNVVFATPLLDEHGQVILGG
jgi:hypothetical protein